MPAIIVPINHYIIGTYHHGKTKKKKIHKKYKNRKGRKKYLHKILTI